MEEVNKGFQDHHIEGTNKMVPFINERDLLAAEEQKARDPQGVDELLMQEMMRLSHKDRNDIQEEIHGVKCLAVEETPELVERALYELACEVDERTPDHQKKAYLQSQQPPKELPEHQRILHELHQLEPLPQSSYVNDVEFKLRFLRCELFDIPKSAKRMLNFLDLVLELFGDYALRRPIRLSDFTKEEMRYMRKGRFQIMPNRDRSGRRISTIFPEHEHEKCPPLIKAKITLYQSWAVGYNDVETQRKGHVILVWFDKTFPIKFAAEKLRYRFDVLKSNRVCAIHVCSPDTPYFRMRRSIAVMRCGNENRSALRIHLGESVELQYALQGYGIPAEDIPISWTGKIKIKNLVQWMRIRHAVESYDEYLYSSGSSASMPPSGIVECPQPNDVLFRKGNSYVSHPGNATLRATIEALACTCNDDKEVLKRPKQLASEIFDERKELQRRSDDDLQTNSAGGSIGRYLIWNNQKDWWNEMTDKDQICLKLEYMVRELRKSCGKGGHNKGQKCANGHNRKSQKRVNNSSNNNNNNNSTGSPAIIKVKSDTVMFRSQDGRSDDRFGARFSKIQRKSGVLDCTHHSRRNYNSGSSDEDERHQGQERTTECFGLQFSPCNF